MSSPNSFTESAEHPLPRPEQKPFLESVGFGTICGLVSAVGYMAANICLRKVSDLDPVWVSAVKALPTVVLTAPWLVLRGSRGQSVFPRGRTLVALTLAALLGQLAGNVCFQWSLGVIGLALVVPLSIGIQIVSSALLGRMFLGEGVSLRTFVAIGLLIAATGVLSSGAGDAYSVVTKTAQQDTSWLELTLGVGTAACSGLAYAILGVVIRRGVTGNVAISSTLFTVCSIGLMALSLLSWQRIGWAGMFATSQAELGYMLLAGIANAVAFMSLTKALQLTTIVYCNALGASNASMAAICGVMIFGEVLSRSMIVGVLLTVIGLLLIRGQSRHVEPQD